MAEERAKILIKPMSCAQIDEHIFKFHNFDGQAAENDLLNVMRYDAARKRMKSMMPFWMGMTAVSGYNMTRMGVLSNSGRVGAIGGLVVGGTMVISSLMV